MNELEDGKRLQGSIFKDEQAVYEDRNFIISINKEKEALGENSLQIDLLDENVPSVVENDLCHLVLKEGHKLEIQVTTVAEVAPQFMIIFSFEPHQQNPLT